VPLLPTAYTSETELPLTALRAGVFIGTVIAVQVDPFPGPVNIVPADVTTKALDALDPQIPVSIAAELLPTAVVVLVNPPPVYCTRTPWLPSYTLAVDGPHSEYP
jgi:hypothetical protein